MVSAKFACPNAFGLLPDFEPDENNNATAPTSTSSTTTPMVAAVLDDDDAERTSLPPGLLDSTPRDTNDTAGNDIYASPTERFLNDITMPPPTAALPLPQAAMVNDSGAAASNHPAANNTQQQRRQSERQRLVHQSGGHVSGDPASRALMVQLKKWGAKHAPTSTADAKKKTCLGRYSGMDRTQAEAALNDLLATPKGGR